jgi:hypothetical protein
VRAALGDVIKTVISERGGLLVWRARSESPLSRGFGSERVIFSDVQRRTNFKRVFCKGKRNTAILKPFFVPEQP